MMAPVTPADPLCTAVTGVPWPVQAASRVNADTASSVLGVRWRCFGNVAEVLS
jgi:hypothetical protein